MKSLLEEASQGSMSRGVQLLGQIKNGSCRPRAILFKVLADTVGLESKLMVVCYPHLETGSEFFSQCYLVLMYLVSVSIFSSSRDCPMMKELSVQIHLSICLW